MCEAGFIKIIQIAASNLAVQKCFNNLATKKKKLNSCKGEEEKAQLVHAEAEMGVCTGLGGTRLIPGLGRGEKSFQQCLKEERLP